MLERALIIARSRLRRPYLVIPRRPYFVIPRLDRGTHQPGDAAAWPWAPRSSRGVTKGRTSRMGAR
jgi:hypothetical protein